MAHIDGEGMFLMALFHIKALGPMWLLKTQIISLTWLRGFLGVGLVISMRGWEQTNKDQSITQRSVKLYSNFNFFVLGLF